MLFLHVRLLNISKMKSAAPKMPVKSKKIVGTQDVLVNLKPQEKKALALKARLHGVTPSDFVRLALNQYFMNTGLDTKLDAKRRRVSSLVE